jgi:hypothetical protein
MLPVAAPVAAAAPDNDNLANATAVTTLPFDAYPDVSQATLEAGEAIGCDSGYGMDQSVWYSWTAPQDGTLRVQIDGSWGGQTAAVFGPLDPLPTDVLSVGPVRWCVYDPGPDYALNESVQSGETYLFQLTTVSAWGVSPHLGINLLVPPANDNKAQATVISGLPFTDTVDLSVATVESGENLCGNSVDRTAWHRYTPSADSTMEVGLSRDQGSVSGALYGPDGQPATTTVGAPGCFSSDGGPTRFLLKGGVTYDLQVGDSIYSNGSEPVHVSIQPGPPPFSASLVVNPNGTVKRVGGVAYVSFTVTCNNPGNFWIYATLRERLTRTILASAFAATAVNVVQRQPSWSLALPMTTRPSCPGRLS